MSIRTKRNSRRFIAAAAAVAVAASSFIATSAGPAGALTAAAPSAERYSGDNRFATAAAVATSTTAIAGCATDVAKAGIGCKTFSNASAIVIVNGRTGGGADGLAAASIAGAYNAPILLVETDSIPAATLTALQALTTAPWGTALSPQVQEIIVVGGASAVSAGVVGQLAEVKPGVSVRRIAGADRYETAINVALAVSNSALNTGVNRTGARALGSKAILVVGDNWPDALSASPLAYNGLRLANGASPILLNNGATLRSDVAAALQAMNSIDEVLIVGGTSVVPEAVITAIRGLKNANGGAIGAVRAGGANRYATAVAASASSSAFTTSALGVAGATAVVLANGENAVGPWDALSAGPLAGNLPFAALLLTESAAPPAATAAWHTKAANTLSKVYAVGGTSVISDAAATAAVGAATPTSPTQPTGALKLTNVTSASQALLTAGNGIHATLAANPSGTFAGVSGNFIGVTLAAGPAGTTGFSAIVTTSAGTLDNGTGPRILVLGPSVASFAGLQFGQLATAINATGAFTLTVAPLSSLTLVSNSASPSPMGTAISGFDATGPWASATGNLVGGATSAQLTLTFNTAVVSVSTLTELVFTKAGSGGVAITGLNFEANTMVCSATLFTCTSAQFTGTTAVQVAALIGTVGNKPEMRLPVGKFENGAGTEVPAATVPLTIS